MYLNWNLISNPDEIYQWSIIQRLDNEVKLFSSINTYIELFTNSNIISNKYFNELLSNVAMTNNFDKTSTLKEKLII